MVNDQNARTILWSPAGLVLFGLGAGYAVGSAVVMTGIHDKRERLPRAGVES
jgi:hypothetical protein